MNHEAFPQNTNVTESEEQVKTPSEGSRRFSLEEKYFEIYINNKILSSYEDELKKFHFSEEQIDEFRYKVLDLNPDERERLFATSWERKEKSLPVYLKRINSGKETIESYIASAIALSRQQQKRVGYHTSRNNIIAKRQRAGEYWDDSWIIAGDEIDHRDGDLGMAYYSYDYKHLYRVKNPKYIYIICIEENSKSGHRKDGNNQWGRAPKLSVIAKVDCKDVVTKINELVDEDIKNGQ